MDTIPKLDAVARYFPSILKATRFSPFCVNLCIRFRLSAAVELELGSMTHEEYPGSLAGDIFAWLRVRDEGPGAIFNLSW